MFVMALDNFTQARFLSDTMKSAFMNDDRDDEEMHAWTARADTQRMMTRSPSDSRAHAIASPCQFLPMLIPFSHMREVVSPPHMISAKGLQLAQQFLEHFFQDGVEGLEEALANLQLSHTSDTQKQQQEFGKWVQANHHNELIALRNENPHPNKKTLDAYALFLACKWREFEVAQRASR